MGVYRVDSPAAAQRRAIRRGELKGQPTKEENRGRNCRSETQSKEALCSRQDSGTDGEGEVLHRYTR